MGNKINSTVSLKHLLTNSKIFVSNLDLKLVSYDDDIKGKCIIEKDGILYKFSIRSVLETGIKFKISNAVDIDKAIRKLISQKKNSYFKKGKFTIEDELKKLKQKVKIKNSDTKECVEMYASSLLLGSMPNFNRFKKRDKPVKKAKYSTKDYIKDCSFRNDFYYTDYSKIEYKLAKDYGEFTCKKHNMSYSQRLDRHKEGRIACKYCLSTKIGGCYTEENILSRHSLTNGTLYFVKMGMDDEVFYKVGITRNDIKNRFKDIRGCGYDLIEVIYEESGRLLDVFKLEQYIINNFKDYLYLPKISFGGRTECFSENVYEIFRSNMCQIEEDWNRQCELYCEENGLIMNDYYYY